MNVAKSRIENLLKDLPDEVDTEELMYRLYLLEKIESGEADLKKGKVLSQSDAMNRLSKKWQK